ncbi:hypothetical protein [Shewanella colwelliana]|uniref:hypothetical protein n=1 Tax=Shewanella colwelliana TaxID=23 RepID=UPI00048D05C1|nr:hypothetical protein [Shewanella colwelliana]
MNIFKTLLLISCLGLFFALPAAGHGDIGQPSSGAKQMAGAKGTFAFKPADWIAAKQTWWKDSDGVAPGVAGCHIGTDEHGVANGRMFGEACLPDGILVESNPGKDVVHVHGNDTGHPDTFDCNAWCVGEGNTTGRCEVAKAPPCEQSARCVCR